MQLLDVREVQSSLIVAASVFTDWMLYRVSRIEEGGVHPPTIADVVYASPECLSGLCGQHATARGAEIAQLIVQLFTTLQTTPEKMLQLTTGFVFVT